MLRALLGGIVGSLLIVTPATAANGTVDCGELQSALNGASPDAVITLDEVCTTGFPYTLPAVPITLDGAEGAGFHGGPGPQLTGGAAAVTIEHLDFEGAEDPAGNGGALRIDTKSAQYGVTLFHDSFVHDAAVGKDAEGGGAYIVTAGKVSIEDSTFTKDLATSSGGGLTLDAESANLAGDMFAEDSAGPEGGFGGGLAGFFRAPGSMLSNSLFTKDTATEAGGGASIVAGGSSGVGLVLGSDTFTEDAVAHPEETDPSGLFEGGGLRFLTSEGLLKLEQRDNTFDSNTVSFKASPNSSRGAGESVDGAELMSTGDHFTNNVLQPPSEATNEAHEPVYGWGAGLSVLECGDTFAPPPEAQNAVSTLEDGVVAGNTLISGPTANGAGIYVGVLACPASYTTLNVLDSTVAGNVVSGASGPIAGIDGGPHDFLSLANTILDEDTGGLEIGGFGFKLANVAAAYSDACLGISSLTGPGNICVNPDLIAPGPPVANVHETALSPTIRTGLNALVPSGLALDTYGSPRIFAPTGACGNLLPAIVDIGADEFTEFADLAIGCTKVLPNKPASNAFELLNTQYSKGGKITLTLKLTDAGMLTATGTLKPRASHAKHHKGRRKTKTYEFTPAKLEAPGAGAYKLKLTPSKAIKSVISHKGTYNVSIAVTFAPTGGVPAKKTTSITFKVPAKKRSSSHHKH